MSATAYLFHLLKKSLMPLAQISLENQTSGNFEGAIEQNGR